jgi:hypothetical protein
MIRRGVATRPAVIALAALSLTLLPTAAAKASGGSDEPTVAGSVRVHMAAIFRDGRREDRTLVFTGTPERAWASTDAADWVTVGSRVTNTSSWRPRSKVNYGMTELARQNPSKKLMKKGAALVNKNRGTANAPSHKIKNSKHDIIPENQFASRSAYLAQFHLDHRNTVIEDELDEFVDFLPLALGGIQDADIFAIHYEYATVGPVAAPAGPNPAAPNGATERWEGAYWIEEADIYVRSDVFERFGTFQLNVALVFGYLSNSGYEQTGWTDDALGFVNPFAVTEEAFNNGKSDMWLEHQARDQFYYDDVTGASTAVAGLEMIPIPGTVIDIGGNIAWLNGLMPPLGGGPVLVQSKPSAYNGNKKAVTKIFWIDPGPPVRLRRVTTLKNNLENWPRVDQGIPEPWYPLVRFNSIRIAKQKNLDQIVKAIADHCAPMTIRGLNFTCVLPVQIKHTAYASENGGKQTIAQEYYLMDSSSLRQ